MLGPDRPEPKLSVLPQFRIRDEDLAKLAPAQQKLYRARLAQNPPRTIAEVSKELGIAAGTAQNQWTRVRAKLGYDPLAGISPSPGRKPTPEQKQLTEMKTVAPRTMVELLGTKARVLLEQIDVSNAKKAGVGELARGAESLLKARALMLGEPTQILRVEERTHILDLLPKIAAEATRRGYVLHNGTMKHKSEIPVSVVDVEATPVE